MPNMAEQYEGDDSVARRDSESIHSGDFELVAGFDALSESLDKCIKGVKWKDTPAQYYLNSTEELLKLERQLENGTYKQRKTKTFTVTYPKPREIVSVAFRDRVFHRSLNDKIIYPRITRSFIYDNMACQKGKGPDKARERIICFLQKHYRKYGRNGYVLKCDVKGYYPNMSHQVVKDCFRKVIDGWTYQQASTILDSQNSGDIGYSPGSQMIQIAGIGILNEMDHYIKEQLGIKFYLRYMDDFVLIHPDKQYLLECKVKIAQKMIQYGCEFNTKKTEITKLADGFRFLGFDFRLTDTGKVIMSIDPKNVKHERRKLVKMVHKAEKGEIPIEKVDECYFAWRSHAMKGNGKKLVARMDQYYKHLWKERKFDDNFATSMPVDVSRVCAGRD